MALALDNDDLPLSANAPQRANWSVCAGVAIVIVASLWIVGHSFGASLDAAMRSEVSATRLENKFAVRQASTQSNSVVGFFMLGGAGALCWLISQRSQLRINLPLLLIGGAYIGWCFASLLWSIEPSLTIRKGGILALLLVAGLGLAARFELDDLLWVFVLALAMFVGLGILAELVNGTFKPWRGEYRFSGTIGANDQGLQCALLALAAMLTRWPGPRDRPWLRYALVGIGLGGLWLSKSRTTLAAFVVAAALAMVLRARGTTRWLVLGGCLLVAAVGGGVYSFLSVSVVGETAGIAAMGREEDVNTLTGRLPLWGEAWKAALHRPLVGHGFGAYWNSKNVLRYSDMFEWQIPHAHNAYIDHVLAVGFVGLTLYVVWVLSTAIVAWVRYERSGRGAELFIFCLLIMSLVHGASESKIPGAGVGALTVFVFLCALIIRPPLKSCIAVPARATRFRPTPWRRCDAIEGVARVQRSSLRTAH
jgi:exopolysaccharide production protein ExoQ